MAVQILNKEGRHRPFLYCDHCSLEIFDASLAHAIWLGDPGKEEGLRFGVGYVHQECADDFGREHPAPKGSQWFRQGLNRHLHLLLCNSGYDGAKGKAASDL